MKRTPKSKQILTSPRSSSSAEQFCNPNRIAVRALACACRMSERERAWRMRSLFSAKSLFHAVMLPTTSRKSSWYPIVAWMASMPPSRMWRNTSLVQRQYCKPSITSGGDMFAVVKEVGFPAVIVSKLQKICFACSLFRGLSVLVAKYRKLCES